jgi:integrase/recombinase XerD
VTIDLKEIVHADISDYLAHKKRLGLAASSIKLVVVAVKIFFRWLQVRGRIPARSR